MVGRDLEQGNSDSLHCSALNYTPLSYLFHSTVMGKALSTVDIIRSGPLGLGLALSCSEELIKLQYQNTHML